MSSCAIEQPGTAAEAAPGKPPSRWRQWLELNYGLDIRSLALFRICMALVILGDLLSRSVDMKMFYTDFGVLPRYVLIQQFMDPWIFSFHLLSGQEAIMVFMFLLAAVFALFMLVGWRTRLFVFLSWLMLISLQGRNHMVLQGGDVLFRVVMFWGMFLPLGLSHSVDQGLDTGTIPRPRTIFSAGSVALMVQIALLYWFAVMMKHGQDWRDGTAVYYALSLEQMSTPLGRLMLHAPFWALRFLSYMTLAVEGLAPV